MVSIKHITTFILLLGSIFAYGQNALSELSLDRAYELLEGRYPALKDGEILTDIHQKTQLKLDKDRLPAVFLKADGRLQSQSVQLDVPDGAMLPFDINLPLYSAKSYLEGQYMILDGGVNKAQKHLAEVQLKADLQSIEINRFSLRERINQLFVNIVILREQAKLFDISLADLAERKAIVEAGVEEGVLLGSELSRLRVKELEIKALQDNVHYKLQGLVNTLSQLLGTELVDSVRLDFPSFADPRQIQPIERPEQQLFQLQQEAIMANAMLIDAAKKPKLSAFAQGGVGYPNPLNFLENATAPYGVVGLQFNWRITDWKRSHLDKEMLALNAQRLQNARETFEFNLSTREASYLAEVTRLQKQLIRDQEIVELQGAILTQLADQLDGGVITSSDYVTQVNAELSARQNRLIHETELLKLQLEFWNERGGK